MERGKLLLATSDDIPVGEVVIATCTPKRLDIQFEGFVDSTADALMGAGMIGLIRKNGKDAYIMGSTHDFDAGLYDWLDAQDLPSNDPRGGVKEFR